MTMIEIITASAGSGKTTRLARALSEAIERGDARPEAVVATTFTKKAAAELQERARKKLLESGKPHAAHRLLAARVGTVNSVCGRLVEEFAFELGLPPQLQVWDETIADRALERSVAAVITGGEEKRLSQLGVRVEIDARAAVRRVVQLARTNDLGVAQLAASAERSLETMRTLLGPRADDGAAIDRGLVDALAGFVKAFDPVADTTKGSRNAVDRARGVSRRMRAGVQLPWREWASLAQLPVCKGSATIVAPVHAAAARHDEHPRLHDDVADLVTLVFDLAGRTYDRYQQDKREAGALDFIDQEAHALALMRREDVKDRLRSEIDLVLVDEFQDTSPIQLAIFMALAEIAPRSIWVGDPKQAIFGFRGTDPKLMEEAVSELESLSDPELVARAVGQLVLRGKVETLATSYRSRPELVRLTSDLFAPAFAPYGIAEERTRLEPHLKDEPPDLGPIVEHWSLQIRDKRRTTDYAQCVAAGVQSILQREDLVRDPDTNQARKVEVADIAVLCRTNAECESVAAALETLDIRAAVPRAGLLSTAEGRLALAALSVRVDRTDTLAAADIARLTTYGDDVEGWLARLLEPSDALPFAEELAAVRANGAERDPVEMLDAALIAVGAAHQCAKWGDTEQRLANLDALRAQAVAFVDHARASGVPATPASLVAHLRSLADTGGGKRADDRQAVRTGGAAVTISTWHRSKGLEWPVTVLFGLDKQRERNMLDVQVATDSLGFDLSEPLAGRWIRFLPSPYTGLQRGTPFAGRVEAHADNIEVVAEAHRENLRLLYVGWTRARDRVVLAVAPDKMLSGIVAELNHDAARIGPPTDDTVWGGRAVDVGLHVMSPVVADPPPARPARWYVSRPAVEHVPAYVSPSSVEHIGVAGTAERIGSRTKLLAGVDMAALGTAIHAFLAADRDDLDDRAGVARRLLVSHGVAHAVGEDDVVGASTAFRLWAQARWPDARWCSEWPLLHRLDSGQIVRGSPDLVLELEHTVVIVDHKSFPGSLEHATKKAATYAGQLETYASGVAQATGKRVAGRFIHLPVLGYVVPVTSA